MGWLRRDKDCIALVVIWALLLQAAIVSFASGAHAAMLAGGSESIVLCTAKGVAVSRQLPGQNHQKADHQCCTMACRTACAATAGGIVPLELRVPLPASAEAPAKPVRALECRGQSAEISPAQPRAPPLA
jgi:hypothetical protein